MLNDPDRADLDELISELGALISEFEEELHAFFFFDPLRKDLGSLTEKFADEVVEIFRVQLLNLKLQADEIDFLKNHFKDAGKIILVFLILEDIVEKYKHQFNSTFTSHQIEIETYDNFYMRNFFSRWLKLFQTFNTKAQNFELDFFHCVASHRDAMQWDEIFLKGRVNIFKSLEAVSLKYRTEFLRTFENHQKKKFDDEI